MTHGNRLIRTVISFCIALLTIQTYGANWKLPTKVTVDAGQHARHDCAVAIDFDAPVPTDDTWQLVDVASGQAVPAQVDGADRRRVWWLLSGETPAGKTRQFEFREGKPTSAPQLIVDRKPDSLTIKSGEASILKYNTQHVIPPAEVDSRFGRSAYIHPVWTPGGAIVTDEFPPEHAHQSGVFLAFTKAVFEGRPTNFWEIKEGKGHVRFKAVSATAGGPIFAGFRVEQEHVDGTAPGGKVALNETWEVRAWQTAGVKSGFWIFDVQSTLTCATSSPLELPVYHYGGFAVRGARGWKTDVTSFLTADKQTRADGNHARTRWSDLSGPAGKDARAGFAVFTHPTNFRFPEPVRIHPTMQYFVYTPCPLGDWSIEPGKPHISRYRCVSHDGAPDAARLNQLWQDFAEPPKVVVAN